MKALIATVMSLSMAATAVAAETTDLTVVRAGTQASTAAPPDRFTGRARVDPLFQPEGSARTSAAYVTFEPGARTAWHTHPLGQTLVITAGAGRVQRWGGPMLDVRPGDVVSIPPGVKHWHGAGPATGMTHIAIQERLDGTTVDWLEQVSEAQYEER